MDSDPYDWHCGIDSPPNQAKCYDATLHLEIKLRRCSILRSTFSDGRTPLHCTLLQRTRTLESGHAFNNDNDDHSAGGEY
ncbi:hypothetical protein BT96DRAFT_921623 [Gymnopus androsaceus JB14]|uniref:Uncharacterized protein n=1 Tax=Gymnopus androsaceus JB14 TaxID=1447944 RepID=A0A6A4GBJ3_9AGAR|nr:hypothetical protein BT96DRAFT_930126 [Gymnopus androsaceus JB14]KAE9397206.1 hypothetical protein BT96DRAFT_921623 [Gymnopus androsaceus JB14]